MSNNTTETDDTLAFPVPATVAIGFFICLCIVLTVFGNAVVLLAFLREKSLRNFSDYLILNLAVADLIIGSVSIPFYTPYVLTKKWPFGHSFCLIWLIVDYITPAASALNIGVISLDRYLQVAHPLWARQHRSSQMLAVFLTIPWALPAIYFVPAICLWEVTHGRVIPENECFLPYNNDITVLLIGATIEFLLPFFTVLILNILVYVCIRQRSKRFVSSYRGSVRGQQDLHPTEQTGQSRQTPGNNLEIPHNEGGAPETEARLNQKTKIQKDRKAARSLFIFVFVFAVCWMPYEILATANTICGQCIDPILFEFTFWILWVNSTINPVLYPILHSRYRRAFSVLFSIKHNRIIPVGHTTHS